MDEPLTPALRRLRVAMIVLALIAPAAAVILVRTNFNTCSVLNPLGLPWELAPLIVVRSACALAVLASTTLIIFAFTQRPLRWTAFALLMLSIGAVAPGFIAVMIMSFGDPDPTLCPIH